MSIFFTKRLSIPDKTIIAAFNESDSVIAKGMAVNIYNHNQQACVRKADYSMMSRLCHGFASEDIQPQSWGEIQTAGELDILFNATPGIPYFLYEDGQIIAGAPEAPYQPIFEDKIIQMVGFAVSTNSLFIKIEQPHNLNLPVEESLNTIILLSPQNNAILTNNNINFSWIFNNDADYYNIQISENDDFTQLKINDDINETHVSYFIPAGTYYWRVSAIKDYSRSDWSEVWTFEINI